jgi:transmembrane sensor
MNVSYVKADKMQRKVKKEEKEMKGEYWDIIAKYLAKEELSAEEIKEFEYLSADNEIKRILSESVDIYEKTDLFFNLKKYDTEKALEKVKSQLTQKRNKVVRISWIYKVAAIFILLVASTIAIWRFSANNKEIIEFETAQFDYSNPEIELPDGTKVKLNHGSKISYIKDLGDKYREVTLSGEGFFNVTPNPLKPFIIKTNGASIKVLGTSFNVYAYSESSTVEVIVETGKVELFEHDLSKAMKVEKVLLLPGEKGTFNKKNGTIAKEKAINPNNLSWFTHEIEFKYTRLADVFQTLQRVYNIQITTNEGVDLDKKLSATFSKQKPDYIMEVIAMTQNLSLQKTSNYQYIIRNK